MSFVVLNMVIKLLSLKKMKSLIQKIGKNYEKFNYFSV